MAENPKGAGRKLSLTPEVVEKIARHVRTGNHWGVAAQLAGVKERTFWGWVKIARDHRRPPAIFSQLLQALHEADAAAEAVHVQNLMACMRKDWRASAWYLERKHRDRWGRVERVEQRNVNKDGDDVAPTAGVLVMPALMDESEWLAAAERYRAIQSKLNDTPDDGSRGGTDP